MKKKKTYRNNRLITVVPFSSKLDTAIKIPHRFLWNFPHLKLGIWDFEEKLGRYLIGDLKYTGERWDVKISHQD